jgi:hypothetical protein
MADECWLNSDQKQCCCNCKYHYPDFFHCTTDRKKRDEMGKCICNIQKGWICRPPEFEDHAFSGWDEHSIGCEMYEKKN